MLHILKYLIHKDYRRHKVLQIDDKVLHIFYTNITKDVSFTDTSFLVNHFLEMEDVRQYHH